MRTMQRAFGGKRREMVANFLSVSVQPVVPSPKTESTKLIVTVSAELKFMLDRCAAVHAKTYGEKVDAATVVPHMHDAFMTRDRGFRKTANRSISTAGAKRQPGE